MKTVEAACGEVQVHTDHLVHPSRLEPLTLRSRVLSFIFKVNLDFRYQIHFCAIVNTWLKYETFINIVLKQNYKEFKKKVEILEIVKFQIHGNFY